MIDLLLDTVGTFVSRELYPAAASVDATDEIPAELVDTMRALGLIGLSDQDLELSDVLQIVAAVGRGSAAAALLVVADEVVTGTGRGRTGLRGVRSGVAEVADRRRLVLAVGAAALGAASRAHAETSRYLEQRQAFGQTLADVPVLATALRERGCELDAARAALWAAAFAPEFSRAADAARTATRVAVAACYDAIQLHGGYGYAGEYHVERLARDCISLRALVAELADEV